MFNFNYYFMKNVFIKFGIAMIFLAAIFVACEQEMFDKDDDSLSIDEAKSWFEANQPEFLVLKSGGMSKKTKVIKPSWKGAYASKNREVEVVETHIMANGAFGFATKDAFSEWLATENLGYLTSLSRIVVMRYKDTGEIVSFIMTIVGDKEYLEKKEFKLWDNDYTMKDDDFSGLVLYHSLKGKFVNGWRYTNGEVTHKVNIDFDMDIKLKLKGSYLDCTTTPVYGWFQDCTTNNWSVTMGDVTEYNSETTCDEPYQEMVGSQTQCVVVNTGDVDNSSGSNGGYVPKIINDLDDYPCVNGILATLSDGTKTDAKNMKINPNLTASILNMFDISKTVNLTINVENLGDVNRNATTHRIIDTDSYEITFNSTYLNSATDLSITRTFIHEILHANLLYKYDLKEKEYSELLNLFYETKISNENDLQHNYFAKNYIPVIIGSLFEWCRQTGLYVSNAYLEKMAWGGLKGTPEYEALSNINEIEQILINEKTSSYAAKGRNCN